MNLSQAPEGVEANSPLGPDIIVNIVFGIVATALAVCGIAAAVRYGRRRAARSRPRDTRHNQHPPRGTYAFPPQTRPNPSALTKRRPLNRTNRTPIYYVAASRSLCAPRRTGTATTTCLTMSRLGPAMLGRWVERPDTICGGTETRGHDAALRRSESLVGITPSAALVSISS